MPKGSIVVFTGEIGAENTTTIKAIFGAIKREQREIKVLGKLVDHQFEKVKQDIACNGREFLIRGFQCTSD